MKKAVIQTGGKQYLVAEGETLEIELVSAKDGDKLTFEPLLVLGENAPKVGTPLVSGAKVAATVVTADQPTDKVTSIRFKAKKRVHTVRGHRQHKAVIKIGKITD